MKTWHELSLTYDSLSATAKMYIDGNLIFSANYTIIHGTGGDRNFSTTNPGTGKAFKGFLRNLKIYTGVIIPNVGVEDLAGSSPVRFYPNPNNGSFKIDLLNAAHNPICIEIYNPTGSRILNLTCSNQNIPEEINLSGFSKGIYLAKISDGIKIYAEKIVIH